MIFRGKCIRRQMLALMVLCLLSVFAFGNGGPFIVKYPSGDPAAKGVLARLDPTLKPASETRLRVDEENLTLLFERAYPGGGESKDPLVRVTAAYKITNPTNEEIQVDFGFPILRGIYINPLSMMIRPDVRVTIDEKYLQSTVISNSVIYGIIRNNAKSIIEAGISSNKDIANQVRQIRESAGPVRESARKALKLRLVGNMKWNERDATLLVEYSGLDLGREASPPFDGNWVMGFNPGVERLYPLQSSNLGPLSAIGEQKATQLLAHLASLFDPKAKTSYEEIFTAWGGDVRERAVDMQTGGLRPREFSVTASSKDLRNRRLNPSPADDPTVYARLDYLDSAALKTPEEKSACQAILANLPVVFTFAPMNLLHYRVKFPARSTQVLTVAYSQFAFKDTRKPDSYQIAYVVHPASFWKDFGPIHLNIGVPEGVVVKASVPCQKATERSKDGRVHYITDLKNKTGELYIAIDSESWTQSMIKATLGTR